MDLTSERDMGFAVGPIPWSSIKLWCEAHGIEAGTELFEDVVFHVTELDKTYTKYSEEKAKRDAGKNANRKKIRSK